MSSVDASVVPILRDIQSRLSAIEAAVGLKSPAAATGASEGSTGTTAAENPGVTAYDQYVAQSLPPFLAACDKLGGDVQQAGQLVSGAYDELRKILVMAALCKEPTQAQLRDVLGGVGAKMQAITALTKRNEYERHCKTVSEGIGALNWICVKPSPREFIESFVGGSDYWANNLRKEFRTTNPDQIAFCDTFKALLNNLIVFVKANYLTGLSWNARGVTVDEYKNNSVAAPAAAATPAAAAKPAASTASAADAKGGLFAALNQDSAVTSGLKKVTKDMQTWRSEYKGGDAPPPAEVKKAAPAARPVVNEIKGTPKVEFLPGPSKWQVEYQSTPVDIPIGDKKETVYILGCVGATITISGKCKSIIVDSCKKTTVYFDAAMASVEVVNCVRMNIHVREIVAAVAIDKTDGIVVHLPITSLDTNIVASKSSEMNVSFPDANGDIIERPIPEQYVHRIKGTSVTAEVSDLYGH